MGELRTPSPVALMLAVLWKEDFSPAQWKPALEVFGETLCESDAFEFDFSDYYAAEMGTKLKKKFLVFARLIDPATLPEWKLTAMEIEKQFQLDNRRRVNLDPGYIDSAKLVLATTKNYDHRLYLGRGIYGDVQLRFRHGHYVTNGWTYTDYQRPAHLAFFEKAREKYRARLIEQSQRDESHL
jgi:hypothetical protein